MSSVVVIGEFDGFHLGHRQLVHGAAQLAGRLGRPLVGVVLADTTNGEQLTTPDERCWALVASGATSAVVASFDSSDRRAATHTVDAIVHQLAPAIAVMACLPGETDVARFPVLRDELSLRGVEVVEMPRWCNPDGRPITSALIRTALRTGDIARANDCLGRTFTLTGTVVHGSGLGRTIGFPTANLDVHQMLQVPMHGVYAAMADLADGSRHRAAVNIGVRPTVEHDGVVVVEAHLLDFDGDLYGQRVTIEFRRWLRDEHRFASVDALVAQLGIDIDQTRMMLRSS